MATMDEKIEENQNLECAQQNKEKAIQCRDTEKKILEAKAKIAEAERQKELIQKEFVYFEKCPIRSVETKDSNGDVITGYKTKDKSTPEETFNILNRLTATQDILLSNNITKRAALAQPNTQDNRKSTNIVNQVLADYEPKDSLEAKLCLQEHTLYEQGLRYLHLADSQDQIFQAEFYMKNAIKLLRLHNETVEALNRHRRGGTQRVVVQHIQVNDGGKAVVSGTFEGGGGNNKNAQSNLMLRLCGAKSKQNGHKPCRQPAMANGRCRLHGGLVPKHNPGPKTEEGRQRQHTANWKHGQYSAKAKAEARQFRQFIKECRQTLSS